MIRLVVLGLVVPMCFFVVPAVAQGQQAPSVEKAALPDPSTIERPKLDFSPTAQDALTYDKYYYFHRDGTGFAEAWADIKECDALSSGISYYAGGHEPYPGYYATQYGIGGAIGGAIGSALADAIHGSAQRRRIRRINMRNCMGFKEYQRYGLSKELWEAFNFEEGHGRKREEVRAAALLKQALVASGPKPQAKALGL